MRSPISLNSQSVRFSSSSISYKIAMIITTLLFGAMIVIFILNAWLTLNNNLRNTHENLQTLTNAVSHTLEGSMIHNDKKSAQEILESLHVSSSIIHAEVKDVSNRVVAQYSKEITKTKYINLLHFLPVQHDQMVSQSIVIGNHALGTLIVQEHLDQMWESQITILLQMAIVFGGAFLFAFILAKRLSAAVVEPIQQISSIARSIRHGGGYAIRVNNVSNDEVGVLADEFNDMLATINRREEELKDSEAHLRLSQTGGGIGTWEANLVNHTQTWSENCITMLGFPAFSKPTWGNFLTIVHPDDRQLVIDAIKSHIDSNAKFEIQYRVTTTNGDTRWMRSAGQVQRDINEKPILMRGIVQDITSLKQAEIYELFRSEILELLARDLPLPITLEAIVRGVEKFKPEMLCCIILLESESNISCNIVTPCFTDFNKSANKKFDIIQDPELCDISDLTNKPVIVDDITLDPHFTPYKVLAARMGLSACWFQHIFSSSEQILGTFAIYHHEESIPSEDDKVIIEQSARLASIAIERKRAEKSLIESESSMRVILDTALDAVIKIDDQGRVMDWNTRAHIIFSWTKSEALGMLLDQLIIPERYKEAHRLGMKKFLATGENANLNRRIQITAIRKGGEEFPVELAITPIKIGNSFTFTAFISDITDRIIAENDLRVAATAFESQEGMCVTDANNVILKVNKSFSDITGYSAEEAVGLTPRLLSSGHHGAEFYATMWETVNTMGHWSGEIYNRRKCGEVYPQHLTITVVKDSNGVITNHVATLTDITSNKAAAEEIEHLAFYDTLTLLPNRRLLLDRLNHALAASGRSGKQGALLFLDLDHFKTLNDTRGHDVGDLLLQQVAERLTSCVREGDTVARLGGDEFVVVLEDLSEQDLDAATQAEFIAVKILAALNQPYLLAKHKHHSSTSIGVTLFNGHQSAIEELLKQADIAMYQAKKAGRGTLRFFNPQMQETINARVLLERELRTALDTNQFQLYYQIQVDHLGQPLGAEALIRWLHPERGIVPPLQFIPLTEETGLILPIGQWVLETACAQLKTWQQDVLTRDLTLSINVSAKQFYQSDFVAQVQATVQRHAVDPMQLKLELTESILLENIEDTIVSMTALQAIGVQFSLDDFGTGYSSLQYLKLLPLYQLKIDQSFVREIATDSSDRSIVRTIIAMAQSLYLGVIAEGVETEEQRELLLNNGCKRYQGYLFGKPMPVEQFEELLRQQ